MFEYKMEKIRTAAVMLFCTVSLDLNSPNPNVVYVNQHYLKISGKYISLNVILVLYFCYTSLNFKWLYLSPKVYLVNGCNEPFIYIQKLTSFDKLSNSISNGEKNILQYSCPEQVICHYQEKNFFS